MSEENKKVGAFVESLRRNNSKIKADRAAAISEDAELIYKRSIEDSEVKIKRMRREQEGMLDLSPSDAQSLVLASDFDADSYVAKDIDLGIKIRNETIKLEVAKERYNHLFGGAED